MKVKLIMNQVIEVINKRRSTRSFEQKPVPKEIITAIIEAGNQAPFASATRSQPWRFIVVTNKDKIQELLIHVQRKLKKILKRRLLLSLIYPEIRKKETLGFLYEAANVPIDVIYYAPALLFIITSFTI